MPPEQENKFLPILATVLDTLNGPEGKQGEKGDKGDTGEQGPQGVPGLNGKDGVDGIDGQDGKDGEQGPKGDRGDDGKDGYDGVDGRDGVDGKDGESVTPELLQQVTLPIIVQNVQKAVSSKTIAVADVVGLADALSSVSGGGGLISILDYGATMDGADDGPAIQDSLDDIGYAYVPEGTTTILTQVVMPSNSAIYGLGIGRSIIQPHPSMARTTRMISTTGPSGGNRQTENIVIRDITLDGSTRTWPVYPAAGYDDSGYLVYLAAVDSYHLHRVEVMNQQSFGIADAGGKNGKITDCDFHDNGNPHKFSPALYISSSGNNYSITDISNAANARITLKTNGNVTTGPTSMYISGVRSMDIPDDVYNVTFVSNNVFELTGINTTLEPTFVVDMMAYVGISGNTGAAFVPNINPIVSGNHFNDNAFHHVCFTPTEGGNFENNILKTCGESAIFCENSRNVNFVGNKIEDTTVTSIVANGLELNRCANVTVTGNYFADTATTPMSMNNGQNIIIDANTFNRSIKDNTVTFPVGPDYPSGGPAINLNSVIKIGSNGLLPGRSISVTNNTVMDLREDPQATSIVNFVRNGTETYLVYDILIKDNNWAGSGVASVDMVTYAQVDTVDLTTIDISGNLGHDSAEDSFETVSKNLDASGATLAYTGDNLTSITYSNGIIKTLAYTGDNLTSVVLSGSTPAGIDLTKTLSYTGDNLTGVAYT